MFINTKPTKNGGLIIISSKSGDFAQRGVKRIEVSRTIIGNYERNANTPSIEVLMKMAKTFNVTVDYLIGEGEISSYDKEVMKRIEDIDKLDPATKEHLFFLVDNIIQNFKTKQAFAK